VRCRRRCDGALTNGLPNKLGLMIAALLGIAAGMLRSRFR
jgi:hypothetical protein